jgi:class 3 adenylate cyclase
VIENISRLPTQEPVVLEQPVIPEPAQDISFLQTFLARSQALPKTACGACLFSDISGFTPLTEALRKSLQPRQGAEVLNSIINSVFEALISQVHHYGGDVLGFAGDAFTCWFDEQESGENISESGALLNAMACCATAIQNEMKRFSAVPIPGGKTQALLVRVGIAYGVTRRLLLGAPEYGLFDLMVGSPLSRMAAAEHHAQVGEIICAPEVVAAIRARVEWSDAGDGYGRLVSLDQQLVQSLHPRLFPQVGTLSQEVLRPYFPPEIMNWLVYGTADAR